MRIGPGAGGTVSATDLTKAVEVSDCVIEDGGHVHREGCGVLLQAAQDCVVTHNSIGNLYYTGVSMGWTWSYTLTGKDEEHGSVFFFGQQSPSKFMLAPSSDNGNNEVSFNEIYDIGKGDLSDMGCVCCFERPFILETTRHV